MEEKYSITGMTCSACSSGIEKAVCKMDGVLSAQVSLMGECMVVEFYSLCNNLEGENNTHQRQKQAKHTETIGNQHCRYPSTCITNLITI